MTGIIHITGCIGSFEENGTLLKGVELIDVVSQVNQQPTATAFKVVITSEGGLVDVGFDIYNYLESLKATKHITTIGTGIVASVATVIFMAGNVRQIMPGTEFMVHLPHTEASGNADTLREVSEYLAKYEKKMLDFYKKALNINEDEAIRPILKNETWLTPDQLTALGFITEPFVKVAAKAVFNVNTNKMSNLTDSDKNWFEKQFSNIFAKFKGVKNKIIQDAAGTEIDFTELDDNAAIAPGATAVVAGEPAQGDYLLPSGETYVFDAGKLTEIKPAAEPELTPEEAMQMKAENESLKAENDAIKAKYTALETKHKDIEKDVKALQAGIKSKYQPDETKKDKTKVDTSTDRAAGIKSYLTKRKEE